MTERPPAPVPEEALVHQVRADADLARLKVEAIRAHASQSAGLIRDVGEPTFRRWWSVESFVAAEECLGTERAA